MGCVNVVMIICKLSLKCNHAKIVHMLGTRGTLSARLWNVVKSKGRRELKGKGKSIFLVNQK